MLGRWVVNALLVCQGPELAMLVQRRCLVLFLRNVPHALCRGRALMLSSEDGQGKYWRKGSSMLLSSPLGMAA